MSLRTQLPKAVGSPMRMILREFGVPCNWNRPTEGSTQRADGSVAMVRTLQSMDTVLAIVARANLTRLQKRWGNETTADGEGMASLSVGVKTGDILTPTEGALANLDFAVGRLELVEAAGMIFFEITEIVPSTVLS